MVLRIIATCALCAGLIVPARSEGQQPSFKSGVTAVRVDVLVSDGGRPVTGLSAADFEVRDNGVVQSIQGVADTGGVDLGLVLDASASLAGERLRELVDAADGVLADLREGDRAAVLSFNQDVQLLCPPTRDRSRARQALAGLRGLGTTALYDAVCSGTLLVRQDARRPLLLVFSDGMDNSSWLSSDQLLDSLGRAEIVVYVVTPDLSGPGRRQNGPHEVVLERIAEQTGGEVLRAASAGLRPTFKRVLEEFRIRYLLSFVPSGVASGDGWHSLEVKLKSRKGRVTARPRYFSGSGK